MTRSILLAASILLLSNVATAQTATKDASGETQCPAHFAVAKSTTVDPATGAIRVCTICVSVNK